MYGFYRNCSTFGLTSNKGRLLFVPMFARLFSSAISGIKDYIRPRRAILYVPGNDRRKIEKIRSLDVDCAVLDCEDGVAINKKSEARNTICGMSNNDFGRSEYAVRINSIDSGLAEEDLLSILDTKRLPDAIMIPKVENVNHVTWIKDKLRSYYKITDRHKRLSLLFFIESARSLLNLKEICETAVNCMKSDIFELEGLVFGSDDFCADIGATRSVEGSELLTARQTFLIIAKCFRLQAIDMVHINYKDVDSLYKVATDGAKMGFTGKQVIHPDQIPIVQKAFSPSQEKIDWARELIKEFELHQKDGKGAFTFQGVMIDKPLLLQAKNIIKLSEIISG